MEAARLVTESAGRFVAAKERTQPHHCPATNMTALEGTGRDIMASTVSRQTVDHDC
jgi:hypothetical protein